MANKKKTVGTSKKTAVKKAGKSAKTKSLKTKAKGKAITPSKDKVKKKSAAAPKAISKKKAIKKTKKSTVKKATVKKTKEAPVKKTAKATAAKTKSSAKKENGHKSSPREKATTQNSSKTTQAVKTETHKKENTKAQPEGERHNHTAASAKTAIKRDSRSARSTEKPKFIYKPEPSILDNPQENNTPRKRYSDNELQEFKELIQRKLESAKKELIYLQGLITRKDEAGTDDTENKYMGVEDGSGTMEREQLSQLASRQIQYIDHLEKALVRIENKTYGICRVTGKLIDKARLRAVPHATLSIEAKLANKR